MLYLIVGAGIEVLECLYFSCSSFGLHSGVQALGVVGRALCSLEPQGSTFLYATPTRTIMHMPIPGICICQGRELHLPQARRPTPTRGAARRTYKSPG